LVTDRWMQVSLHY